VKLIHKNLKSHSDRPTKTIWRHWDTQKTPQGKRVAIPGLGDYAMASIKQDPNMKFLAGFITYGGKGVPKQIYKKVKTGA
jgi:hypothetical protein